MKDYIIFFKKWEKARQVTKKGYSIVIKQGLKSWLTGLVMIFMLLGVLMALTGCLVSHAITPYPDTIYVPHPSQVDPNLGLNELHEMYSTSPNRDPDGLGVLPAFWLQSQIFLIVPAMARQWELENKIAYARTEEEQAIVLQVTEEFYNNNVVFEGNIFSNYQQLVYPEYYLPEGIYLLDDRGKKFYPISVYSGDPRLVLHIRAARMFEDSIVNRVQSFYKYHRIIFPREAINPNTRAITLYYAALHKRMSFTWVFDADYIPERKYYGPEHGAGFNRMFRVQ